MYNTIIEENQAPSLTFLQYKTFVLIYAGHVDYNYSDEEINFIQALSDIETHNSMYNLFLSMSDYSSLKLILKYRDVYLTNYRMRLEMQDNIMALFTADGEYSRPEKVFLDFLSRMMRSYQETSNSIMKN